MSQVIYYQKYLLAIICICLLVVLLLSIWVYEYTETCGDVQTCAAMREALRVANEKLAEQKYCAEELAGLRRSNELTVKDNVGMYEQLIECGCPPERWADEKEDVR